MDLTDLAQQHGPLGLLAVVVLLFVRLQAQSGIKITVHHDPEQVKALADAIAKTGSEGERIAEVESDVVDLREKLATVKVKLDERTKAASASSAAPKAAAKS